VRKPIAVLIAVALTCLVGTAPAQAAFGLKDLGLTFTSASGGLATEAGSHPYAMNNTLAVTTAGSPGSEVPEGAVRDLRIDLPPGFSGDVFATPRCTGADFAAIDPHTKDTSCADSSAVGVVEARVGLPAPGTIFAAVYNLVPTPGKVAKLGFVVQSVPVTVDIGLSEEAPYHVVASLTDVSQAILFYGSNVTLWGNPASSIHDDERGDCIEPTGPSGDSCPIDIAERPFLTLPTACTGPLTTTFSALAWNTGESASGTAATTAIDGCSRLPFAPTIQAQPTGRSAESPTGLDFEVEVRDEGLRTPTGYAQSTVKKAVATLPEGMAINPSQAEGLGACSEADLAREKPDSEAGSGCPNSSKIGGVEVETPILEGQILKGSLFVATPFENPTGSLIALYMVIKSSDLGVVFKLRGKVEADPETGQLSGSFDELPQFPFSHFRLHFREGERSSLVTPPRCGDFRTEIVFTPWANPQTTYTTGADFKVTSGTGGAPCPAGPPPFRPGFEAGSINNSAGLFSPFYMRLTRRDGEQNLTRFSSVLPPGVTGKIAGLQKCSDGSIGTAKARSGRAERAQPSCPTGSRIGHVLAGAGVGSELTRVPGEVYLAGPYGTAPLSAVAIVPAVAGPFDLGTVVTRVALTVNPDTAEVEVDGAHSDPIPHILAGIPLKLRDLRVYVDRPDFALNPTDCNPPSTRAILFGGFLDLFSSADDVSVPLSARYQAASCASLDFKPKLAMSLTGGTRRGDHPALRSILLPRPGDANLRRATVTLPPSEFIDNAHIQNPCTRVQFNAHRCPRGSVLGTATAYTPLLDEPLRGPVYFRSNGGERLLPDIVLDLNGLFHIVLVGHVDAVNARVRTTFASTPDAPTSKVVISLKGGKAGVLVNNRNLCAHKIRAKVELVGHNGRRHDFQQKIKTSCGKKTHSGRVR